MLPLSLQRPSIQWHNLVRLFGMPLRNIKQPAPLKKDKRPLLRVVAPRKKAAPRPASEILIDLQQNKHFASAISLIKQQLGHIKPTSILADLKPMLATLTDNAFDGKDWQFEIKWDGYRTLAYVTGWDVKIRSRNDRSFNAKYPEIADALREWGVNAVLDGEIVVLSEHGKPNFGALQNWPKERKGSLVYYVFDLLWIEGHDLRKEPLTVRREVLKKVFPRNSFLRYSESIDECGRHFFATAKSNGLEGIIAKQKSGPYASETRSPLWLKIKAEMHHEALICGYTKKKDSDRLISSLVLGIPQNGKLKYLGQVGTGFTARTMQALFRKMNPLFTSKCPFSTVPHTGAPTLWVKPQLVCEVKYTELTKDGLMRHPSFQGLREDKTASEINVEAQPSQDLKEDIDKGNSSLIVQEDGNCDIVLEGHTLKLTNFEKWYWRKEKITKGDLVNYYHQVAPYMLPYMKDRPQSLNRHPNGIEGKSFYQKDMKGKVESWMKTFKRFSERDGQAKEFLVCTGTASLLYMVNLGCIELNPWHSRITSPLYPDWCVIDLDPGRISFNKVIETAKVVHDLLESLGISSFPKTSGSTGLHIYIPLGAKYNYEQSRQLAELIATLVHQELPSFTSLVRNPEKRKDKIYIDYLQNRPKQTICAPYSVRPKPGATVSAPLNWVEVQKGLKMQQFTIHSMLDRVKREGDLFEGVLQNGIDLNTVLQSLTALV
jgi:bifunctional non-homologous end joining protein LigD